MAAETAVLVTIATSLASGLLKEVSKKALDAASESSTVVGLKSAISGGLEDDLRRLEKELCKLDSVLRSAQSIDPMQRDNNDLLLLIWLRDVKEAVFYADNLLDEIAYEKMRRKVQIETSVVAKLLSRPDTSFAFRTRIAGKIKKFVSLTAGIHKEAETTLNLAKLAGKASIATYQPPSITISVTENLREIRANPDTSIVVGRQAVEELIVTKLCSSPDNNRDLHVVAIVGRSGVGKTTLGRMVYDNKTVGEHFGKRAWIFVSDNLKLERFLDEMLQSVTGQSHNLSNISAMEDKLRQCLQEEKRGYLVVLDDVWNTDEQLWKSVESSFVRVTRSTRCRVLVTTQSSDIARLMCASSSTHELKDLGEDDAWALFKKLAFANKTQEQLSDWEDVGRRILSKCRGLPLAIKTLGSLLRSMNEKSEWESVERSEIWGLSLEQSNIMPWLLISFHHLPNAAIKQCFVHCSVIIEKGKFVRQSEVIQSWMAQGFIQPTAESKMSMEDMGETYVSNLVANGHLQVQMRNDYRYLWMHDLVHDLACFISKGTSWIPRVACDFEAEHIRISNEGNSESECNLPKGKTPSKLRTLICSQATLSVDFATQAKFLRDLRLIRCGMKKVPSSIGRLKHLRYLSLCGNPFRHFPESITTLFNLQTLDLEQCYELEELPREITTLGNLRHILASDAMKMPKGMGQLTCLRTLPPIKLDEVGGFEIREMKSLAFLSGDIEISGLQVISSEEDVLEACSLRTRSRIRKLSLQWQSFEQRVANHDKVSNDEEIMDGLHPHTNLEGIVVGGFDGKRLSSWLLVMNHLKTIELTNCSRCEQLPALGQLGSLKEILIQRMENLQVIGVEFYHNDKERAIASSSSHNSRRRILFPRVKHLRLENMEKLRDWIEPSGSIYEVFPCLEKLEVWGCPLLISAPTCFQSLLSLSIHNIRSGEAVMMILTNNSNLTDLEIHGVEQLTSLSHPLLKCSHSLKRVVISKCQELVELFPSFQSSCDSLELMSLCTLRIQGCPNLGTIQGLESCVSMEVLDLEGNRKLELIPDLKNLTRLTSLRVIGFSRQKSIPEWLSCLPSLRELGIGGFSEELDGATHFPKCSKQLALQGWPKLNYLPSELQYLNQLESLSIYKFEGIERLPEWLGCLSSLRELYISDCENLKYLPSLDAMRRLTQLRTLSIYNCPILRERCKWDGGEESHKISHILDYFAGCTV